MRVKIQQGKARGQTILLPHSSMDGRHSERPPRRDAVHLISGLSGLVLWRRGGRGRLGGVAAALLSWRRVFALYEVVRLKQTINWSEEYSRGSVEPHLY